MTDDIKCPICGSTVTLRTAKKGPSAGSEFYVCNRYPECKGKIKYQSNDSSIIDDPYDDSYYYSDFRQKGSFGPDFQGRAIAAIFWFGLMGAAAGAIWACALDKPTGFGALCGGVGSAVFALVMSPAYAGNRQASAGFVLFCGPIPYTIISVIGLIVWLIRWLV